MTTITLDHTLFTGISNPPPPRPNFVTSKRPVQSTPPTPSWITNTPQLTQRPVFQTRPPVRPITDSDHDDRIDEPDFECGVPNYRPPTSTGLVVGGKFADRGQFPW